MCNIFCVRAIPKDTKITIHYSIHCITIVIHFAFGVNLQFHVTARAENSQFGCKYKPLGTLLRVWLSPSLSTKFLIGNRSWNCSVGQLLDLSPTEQNGIEIVSVEEPEIDRLLNRLGRSDTRAFERQTATGHN